VVVLLDATDWKSCVLRHRDMMPIVSESVVLYRAGRECDVSQSADAQSVGGYEHGELMGVIAGELRSRGMSIREYCRGGILRELEITSSVDADKGKVVIGYDGLTTWEFWSLVRNSDGVEQLVNLIVTVLTQDLTGESHG